LDVADIPSRIDVLEENVPKNPEVCVMSQSAWHTGKATANVLPVRLGSADAPAAQVLEPSETCPRLNVAGEISTPMPPTEIEMGVLKSQGTEREN